MVGVQGPQAPGGPGWGAPAPAAAPAPQGSSGEKVLIVLASLVAVAALIGGSVFVVGQRGDEGTDGPDPTEEPTDPTDPTTSSTDDTTDTGDLGPPASYDGFSLVTDDSLLLEVELPDEWDDLNVSGITIDSDTGETTPAIQASTDLDGFRDGYSTSGAEIVLYGGTTFDDIASVYESQCQSAEPQSEVTTGDGVTGQFVLFSQCTGNDGVESEGFAYVSSFDLDNGDTLAISVILDAEADFEALNTILETIVVDI